MNDITTLFSMLDGVSEPITVHVSLNWRNALCEMNNATDLKAALESGWLMFALFQAEAMKGLNYLRNFIGNHRYSFTANLQTKQETFIICIELYNNKPWFYIWR